MAQHADASFDTTRRPASPDRGLRGGQRRIEVLGSHFMQPVVMCNERNVLAHLQPRSKAGRARTAERQPDRGAQERGRAFAGGPRQHRARCGEAIALHHGALPHEIVARNDAARRQCPLKSARPVCREVEPPLAVEQRDPPVAKVLQQLGRGEERALIVDVEKAIGLADARAPVDDERHS